MAGKATGERIPGRKYRAIVEAAGIGDSINRIARKVGVTWRTVKAVVSVESKEIAERKEELLRQSLRITQRAANQSFLEFLENFQTFFETSPRCSRRRR